MVAGSPASVQSTYRRRKDNKRQTNDCKLMKVKEANCGFCSIFNFKYLGAVPGGTAIPGQPLREAEQAPAFPSSVKNQFNIEAPL